jgi:hypothetical protein
MHVAVRLFFDDFAPDGRSLFTWLSPLYMVRGTAECWTCCLRTAVGDNVSEANCSGATNIPHLDLSVSCEASMFLDHHVRGSPKLVTYVFLSFFLFFPFPTT